MTRRNVWKQGWVFPLFSPDSDDRLSLNFHRFVILYRSCDTRSVSLEQYCLPKGSNGFKEMLNLHCTFSSSVKQKTQTYYLVTRVGFEPATFAILEQWLTNQTTEIAKQLEAVPILEVVQFIRHCSRNAKVMCSNPTQVICL